MKRSKLGKDQSNTPLIFHIFSGGGANIYTKLVEDIIKHNATIVDKPISIAGAVFDSCPGRPGFIAVSKMASQVSANSKAPKSGIHGQF